MSENLSGPPYSGPAVKPILDSIDYPSDMKGLDMKELKQVWKENSLGYIQPASDQRTYDLTNILTLLSSSSACN
jgi:hypothetical protein